MRDFNDRQPVQSPSASKKRLGGYLVEAGLLTPAQVDVALNDQKLTGMRFGEILAARGWVKQQTIEYLMTKVVLPEQQANHKNQRGATTIQQGMQAGISANRNGHSSTHTNLSEVNQSKRRDAPISKPRPSVGQSDSDISWVG